MTYTLLPHTGPQLALSGWGGIYEALVIIHKSPWDPDHNDMQSYYTALLGYDQAYTLVRGVVA
jgi:hypothetical protein